jgi:hypothetical protein
MTIQGERLKIAPNILCGHAYPNLHWQVRHVTPLLAGTALAYPLSQWRIFCEIRFTLCMFVTALHRRSLTTSNENELSYGRRERASNAVKRI